MTGRGQNLQPRGTDSNKPGVSCLFSVTSTMNVCSSSPAQAAVTGSSLGAVGWLGLGG